MGLFVTVTIGGSVILWKGSEKVTNSGTLSTEEMMKEKLESGDDEVKRYAKNSEMALATMFEQIGKGREENQKYLNVKSEHKMKLPGVEWHPKAEKRDKKNQQK